MRAVQNRFAASPGRYSTHRIGQSSRKLLKTKLSSRICSTQHVEQTPQGGTRFVRGICSFPAIAPLERVFLLKPAR